MDSRDQRGTGTEVQLDDSTFAELQAVAAPRKLAEGASEVLREHILSGNLRRGTHLVESRLAAQLTVSRGTIREAFRILAAEGLVVEEARRGSFVTSLELNDVREIYDLRAAIEGRAAYLLATRIDRSAIEELTAAVERIAATARIGDLRAVRRQDLLFHETFCALTGNSRLQDVFVRYVPVIQTLLAYDQFVYSPLEATAGQHQAILDAVVTGDPAAAARAAVDHCEESRDKIAAYFASLGAVSRSPREAIDQ
jgi:GntR family transcriptional regulator, gluconate operon transcriptional repressor